MTPPPPTQADPFWPLHTPLGLPDDLTRLNEAAIECKIAEWLEKALREAFPEKVLAAFFTPLRSLDFSLDTDVPMVVRGGHEQRRLVGRFSWMVAYNIDHSSSLLQNIHRSQGEVGRTLLVLSAERSPSRIKMPPKACLAWVTMQASHHPSTPCDDADFLFTDWRVPVRASSVDANSALWHPIIPSANKRLHGDTSVTPAISSVVKAGVLDANATGYRSHVWPLLESVHVMMAMSPAFVMDRASRLKLGGCGLNLLIKRSEHVTPDIMDTALNMVRMLDSLFGTVQHIHEAQMRSQITHEALNAIAHSLGNRSDRLADTYKDCARDLYLQKLVAQGAAAHAWTKPSMLVGYSKHGGTSALSWTKGGFKGESLTDTLTKTIWEERQEFSLTASDIEDASPDARLIAAVEELMVNLKKRNPNGLLGNITLRHGAKANRVSIVVDGWFFPEHREGIIGALANITAGAEQMAVKGLRVVFMMLESLRTDDSEFHYYFGPCDAGSELIFDRPYRGIPIRVHDTPGLDERVPQSFRFIASEFHGLPASPL